MRLFASAAVLLLCCTGCGEEESLPQKPQLRVDRLVMGFGSEVGEAVYVNQEVQESLLIRNAGLEPLKITSVTKVGDSAFTLEGPLQTELKGKQTTFLRVIFKPREPKTYTGTLSIDANHEVSTEWPNPLQIQLRGTGVARPDGGT